jgi:uncharacterized coiled-coil DUF342 family protein
MNKKTIGIFFVIAGILAPYITRQIHYMTNGINMMIVHVMVLLLVVYFFALGPIGLYLFSKTNFQQNLLILLAVWLCELCAWQWYIQTRLHLEGERLQQAVFEQTGAIQGYTNSMNQMDAEIAGLSTRINELKQTAMTNEMAALEQKREITRLHSSSEMMSNEIVQYKDLVDKLESKLKEASEGILKQNDAIKRLASERDAAIQKYNDSIKERNVLAGKYNTLVDRFNKLQAPGAPEGAKP